MTIETRVTFSSADLKALGNPLHAVGSASFDGEISWDYYADEDGLHGLHWYAYKLDYLVDDNKWIPIDPDKRGMDILGNQVAELYEDVRDHLHELAGDL